MPLRETSHWIHTPCPNCMKEHGLKAPGKSRAQSGPCCFCGGERPDNLRGRATRQVTCKGMTVPEPQPEEKKKQQVRLDATKKAPRGMRRRVGRLVKDGETAKPNPAQKLIQKAEEPKKPSVVTPTPTPEPKKPLIKMKPETAAFMEEKRQYAANLAEFCRLAIMGKDERGRSDDFAFHTVKVNRQYPYGEAGAHPHRGIGYWLGRQPSTTHLPRRALMVRDRKTNEIVAMTIRWYCGGTALFGRVTSRPTYKVCPTCIARKAANDEKKAKKHDA